VLAPARTQSGRWHPVALPVVAFAQPPVMDTGIPDPPKAVDAVSAARARSELKTAVIPLPVRR
jgi:hypothetical protein